jgi:hypothetical protein
MALLSGYWWAANAGDRPALELMRFHRREQINKLKAIFSNLLRFKKVDNTVYLPNRRIPDELSGPPPATCPLFQMLAGTIQAIRTALPRFK